MSSFAQTFYPTAKIINGDTVVLISPLQLKFVNRQTLSLKYITKQNHLLQNINTTLLNSLDLQNEINKQQASKVAGYKIGLSTYSAIIEENHNLIIEQKKISKKKSRKKVITATIIGVIVGLVGSIFI